MLFVVLFPLPLPFHFMSVFAQNCNSSVSCALPTDYHTASSDLYLSIKPRALLAKAVGTKAAGFALPTKSLMQGD